MIRRNVGIAALCAWFAASGLAYAATPESARLVASDAGSTPSPSSENFGNVVALSGSVAVVGSLSLNGAYVFERLGERWIQSAKLTDPTAVSTSVFAAAVQGDRIALFYGTEVGSRIGIFERQGQAWPRVATLGPPVGIDAGFSAEIALDGDTLAIGDPLSWNAGSESGAVAIYRHGVTGWAVEEVLYVPSDPYVDAFGSSLALRGDRLVVGAPARSKDTSGYGGAAIVYERTGSHWTPIVELHSATPGFSNLFGSAVALDGDTLVVTATRGEPGHDRYSEGRIEIFDLVGGAWTEVARFTSDDTAPDGMRPWVVAAQGGTITVGAYDSSSLEKLAGVVEVFERVGGVWGPRARLVPSQLPAWEHQGTGVALDGARVLSGAPYADDGLGAAYVFDIGCALDAALDPDGDNLCNPTDDCPETWNPDQADTDGDGLGNTCDPSSCASVASPPGTPARPAASLAPLVMAALAVSRLRKRPSI